MVDITMCCNFDCPLKSKCYRYRAVPDQDRQSFSLFKPSVNLTGSLPIEVICDYFLQLDEAVDRLLPTEVVDNRYERDGKWKGLKDE